MNLEIITKELSVGQVAPERLAQMKDYLAAFSASLMDRQLELQLEFAGWFQTNRERFKSDKAAQLEWETSDRGVEQLTLETRQKKIKVLREAISSHLRVASDQARNLF